MSRDGAEDFVQDVYLRHRDEIYRYLALRTRNADQAADLTQDVFTDAVARMPLGTGGPDATLPWLYAVARHRLLNHLRSERRRRARVVSLEMIAREPSARSPPAGAAWLLLETIKALAASERAVVERRLFRGAPFEEIAAELGTTSAACKMRFQRASSSMENRLSAALITFND